MTKYRRIEVNAFRRRVTVVSGEWRPGDVFDAQPARTDEDVSLDDSNSCEPVEPDSPEGQLILVDAVRSLQQRLSPEARALICADQNTLAPNGSPNCLPYQIAILVSIYLRKSSALCSKGEMKCFASTLR